MVYECHVVFQLRSDGWWVRCGSDHGPYQTMMQAAKATRDIVLDDVVAQAKDPLRPG